MDPTKQKLDQFTEAFSREAAQNARQIIQDVKNEGDAVVKKAQREIQAEKRAYIKKRISEIRNREGSRISAQLLENKRKLFAFRQECASEIEGQVTDKILDFVNSPGYGEHLAGLLHSALAHAREAESITVLLRQSDMNYSEGLQDTSGSVSLSFDEGDFILGGLVVLCPSKSLRIDLSFDTAFGDISGHFAELSGIDLE